MGINCHNCQFSGSVALIPKGCFSEEINIYVFIFTLKKIIKPENFCKPDISYFIFLSLSKPGTYHPNAFEHRCQGGPLSVLAFQREKHHHSTLSPNNCLMRRKTNTHLLTNYHLSALSSAKSRFCQGMRPFNPVLKLLFSPLREQRSPTHMQKAYANASFANKQERK